jgi:acetamidase/formamidase
MIARAKATTGGHLSVGRRGFTLHIGDGHAFSGYGIDEMKQLCIDAGLPVIDSRRVPFDVVAELAASGPMVAVGAEPRVWHSRAFSYVTLEEWAASYRAAGAEIHNMPEVCDEPAS